MPASTVVMPSKVFVPERINFPAPALIKLLAAPLIIPDMVNVPLTVIDASADKINGQDINAVPEISVIATPAFPAIVNIPGPEIIPPAMSVIVEHAPSTFIVTVIPALIVTSSPIPGKLKLPHVAGSSQFPFWIAVNAAALAIFPAESNKKISPIHT